MDFRASLDNKSNTNQAFWVGMGTLSSIALALVSAAILSRYLDKAEYGTYRQIIYVYNTLLVVFTGGLPKVFNYFLPRYNKAKGKEIVFRISKVLFYTGLAFSLCLFIFSDLIANILRNPELSKGLKYFSPVPLLLLPTLGIGGIFSTYKKTTYIAIYNTLTRLLMLLFIVTPVILVSNSYIVAIVGWNISSLIILIIAYYFKNIPFKGVRKEQSELGVKEILTYSIPLVASSIFDVLWRAANQFYISRYFGQEVFAEFSNGFLEIPFVSMITGATATVLMPQFSKIVYEKEDTSQISMLWNNALHKSAILIYPMVVFFLFYSRELVTIVFSEAYSISSKYFTVAMILNFFNIIVFAPLLLSLGEVRFYARLHFFLAIITWMIEYFVVLIFKEPIMIAISFLIISIGGIIVSIMYSAKKLGISFLSLFPIGRFIIIAFHSFISLFLVDLLLQNLLPDVADILFLTISGLCYLGILLISAKWFRIKYKDVLIPMFKKNNSKIDSR